MGRVSALPALLESRRGELSLLPSLGSSVGRVVAAASSSFVVSNSWMAIFSCVLRPTSMTQGPLAVVVAAIVSGSGCWLSLSWVWLLALVVSYHCWQVASKDTSRVTRGENQNTMFLALPSLRARLLGGVLGSSWLTGDDGR